MPPIFQLKRELGPLSVFCNPKPAYQLQFQQQKQETGGDPDNLLKVYTELNAITTVLSKQIRAWEENTEIRFLQLTASIPMTSGLKSRVFGGQKLKVEVFLELNMINLQKLDFFFPLGTYKVYSSYKEQRVETA